MRVLYYNWVDYLDDEARGGGVTVYQRNLMAEIAKRSDIEAVQLSSGISYDLRPEPPRWDWVRHGPEADRDRRIEIINSATLSPSHYSFGSEAQISDTDTVNAFDRVLTETGPYDAIHLNNLEGIPAEVLTLKACHPETRLILSWHNYYPVCPQVNLWHQEASHCEDFDQGRNCANCLMGQPNARLVRLAYAGAYRMKRIGLRPGSPGFDIPYTGLTRGGRLAARGLRALRGSGSKAGTPQGGAGAGFQRRRNRMIDLINAHVDIVHCVSKRTTEIAISYGVDPAKIRVAYIGTPDANLFQSTSPAPRTEYRPLKLIFLGYMRPDKGFNFLLDALEALPDQILARLDLRIAARGGSDVIGRQLRGLATRMHGLESIGAYRSEDLSDLLADRHLGLVPPLWEDNLPQVALEMHCRHLPLLTSDRGGARELSGCSDFRFKAGDKEDFAAKLTAILDQQVELGAYWQNALTPQSVPEHIDQLLAFYRA